MMKDLETANVNWRNLAEYVFWHGDKVYGGNRYINSSILFGIFDETRTMSYEVAVYLSF